MSLAHPWLLTPEALAKGLLFHGSMESWDTPTPKAGSYDSCFWTSDLPIIAQTYIPSWGGKTLLSLPDYRRAERVWPGRHDFVWQIAQMMGAQADILEWDHMEIAKSCRFSGPAVTYQDVANHLESMGYEPNINQMYHIKTLYQVDDAGNGVSLPVPADRLPYGRLVLVEPPADLKVFDFAGDSKSDLTDIQYHKVTSFRSAFGQGFQAVKINDFCQSPSRGNVGHISIGLSGVTIAELHRQGRVVSIPATHRDLTGDWKDTLTEDFRAWHFAEVIKALTLGFPVPSEVLDAHQDRFDALMANQHAEAAVRIPVLLDGADAPSVSIRDGHPSETEVKRIALALRQGAFDQGSAIFTVDAQGQLHCRLGADVVEAARRTGLAVPVQATPLDQDGIGLTFGRLLEAVEYTRAPAYQAPGF